MRTITDKTKIIALISLIAVVIGSAVFLPDKIAGIIALGAFALWFVLFYNPYDKNGENIILSPRYFWLSGNVFHSNNDDD